MKNIPINIITDGIKFTVHQMEISILKKDIQRNRKLREVFGVYVDILETARRCVAYREETHKGFSCIMNFELDLETIATHGFIVDWKKELECREASVSHCSECIHRNVCCLRIKGKPYFK